jgi:hypothetical protein
MEENQPIKFNKNTQKFISEISKYKPNQIKNIIKILNNLENQQNSEANLENKKGWRLMWERTPKPYLLTLGYLVFFGPVGWAGYSTFSKISNIEIQSFYLIILFLTMFFPLIVTSLISYHFIKKEIIKK